MELNHRKNLHYKNSGNNIWNVLSYSYRELFLIENYKYQKEDYTMSEKRNTWQKQVIYSVIKELKTHPTVQSLIDELEKKGYKIGKSTVYRVLSDAVDEGIVMNVYSGDKMEHFDGNTENHYHIRCKVCDRIFDSELPYQDSITQMGVEADSDFVILSHNLEFIGICPSCKDSLKSL